MSRLGVLGVETYVGIVVPREMGIGGNRWTVIQQCSASGLWNPVLDNRELRTLGPGAGVVASVGHFGRSRVSLGRKGHIREGRRIPSTLLPGLRWG